MGVAQGQPWLVNALAYEACFKIPNGLVHLGGNKSIVPDRRWPTADCRLPSVVGGREPQSYLRRDVLDRTHPITPELLTEAKERLIMRRETHLDQLVDKLKEERVRRVIEPILAGTASPDLIPTDDINYV